MKLKTALLFLLITTMVSSCKVAPKKINYGKDHCALCDMTVVDKTHATQYVTKKGKAYMFDAIECMVMKLNKENNEDNLAFILVTDYANPGKLTPAKQASFLISKNIKSPMGANLSAFSSLETAKKAQSMHSGKLYTWKELKTTLAK